MHKIEKLLFQIAITLPCTIYTSNSCMKHTKIYRLCEHNFNKMVIIIGYKALGMC